MCFQLNVGDAFSLYVGYMLKAIINVEMMFDNNNIQVFYYFQILFFHQSGVVCIFNGVFDQVIIAEKVKLYFSCLKLGRHFQKMYVNSS